MTVFATAQEFCFDEMTYSPEQTVFKLFAPNDAKCYVKVGKKKVKMTKMGDCLWTATVKGDLIGQPYVFNTGHGDTPGVFASNGKVAVVKLIDDKVSGRLDDRMLVTAPVFGPRFHIVDDGTTLTIHTNGLGEDTRCFAISCIKGIETSQKITLDSSSP